MSDRVSTTISTSPSSSPAPGPVSGRLVIVGQTASGPHAAPAIVTSLAAYSALYGSRTGGASMYDAAELALRTGVSELVVQRAVGPNPVKASASLDTGKIVVTAKYVGAYANTYTAAWASSTTTLTVVAGSVTETFVGATSAALILAAANSQLVTVTSSGTLPSSPVTATTLTSGADDFANVVWANELAKVSPDLGDTAITVPGIAYSVVGQALATHCASTKRHGFISAAVATTVANLATARTTAAAYTSGEYLDLVGPWVVVPDGAGGTRTVDPTPFAAGLRAAAKRVGPGESAAVLDYARSIADVTPEYQMSAADWTTLNNANVSAIRTEGGYTRLSIYKMVKDPGNTNLVLGGYRDFINAISFAADSILNAYSNRYATSGRISAATGELAQMLAAYSGSVLKVRTATDGSLIDPGYKVQVATGSSPADGRLSAQISLRLEENIQFWDLTIAVGDAGATL